LDHDVAQLTTSEGDVTETVNTDERAVFGAKVNLSRPPCPAIAPTAVKARPQRPTT